MRLNAAMPKLPKRTRTTAPETDAPNLTIRQIIREKDGRCWSTYLVQGWKENGKWQRRQFADEGKARTFKVDKETELRNEGPKQQTILSRLTQDQHDAAVAAFGKLGDAYALEEVVTYFLRHHRPAEFQILLSDAVSKYLGAREDDLRPRTLGDVRTTLNRLTVALDNPFLHDVTRARLERYLKSLRAADGVERASKKFYTNTLNTIRAFLNWCCEKDADSNRPFVFENPAAQIKGFKPKQIREEQNSRPAVTSVDDVLRIMSVLQRWRGGVMVKYYALLYFAGIRPEELQRFRDRDAELIDIETRTITVPAGISKTRHERQVTISENLAMWLKSFPGPVIPANLRRMNAAIRKHFELSQDEARHTFISCHFAVNRSFGDAALQAGNSESIIRKHYLNRITREDGVRFWGIVPDVAARRAVVLESTQPAIPHLKLA